MNREELLKIAKQILFNTEMVQAILDNRKTVTRRNPFKFEMKAGCNPDWSGYSLGEYFTGHIETGVCLYSRGAHGVWEVRSNVVKPKYKIGDILFVRETWQCINPYSDKEYVYKAGCDEDYASDIGNWLPSIHMPKEAARIFLKVKDVRVEKLQKMYVDDAINEGAWGGGQPSLPFSLLYSEHPTALCNAVASFAHIWDSTIKKQNLDCYGWDANPWVWVIEFERVEVYG